MRPNKTRIKGWDRRYCDNCKRSRVHYRRTEQGWTCIGRMPGHVGARCGQPVSK